MRGKGFRYSINDTASPISCEIITKRKEKWSGHEMQDKVSASTPSGSHSQRLIFPRITSKHKLSDQEAQPGSLS